MGSKLEDEKKDTEKAELSQNEDIVESSIGGLGPWHIRLCILIAFVKFPIAWHQLSYSFLAPEVQFTCIDNTTDKCSPNCTEHVFDRSVFTETIITQWDLVCGKSSLAALSQTVTMAGILVGNMLFGYLSDRFGRRNPLIWAVIIQGVTGILTAFSPWFSLFIVMRFLLACATGGTMVTSFVLIMESIGKKWRTAMAIFSNIPITCGHLLLPLISYNLRNWQHLQLATSIPSLFFISYFWFLSESPRYFLATNQRSSVIKLLTKAATQNKLPTDEIVSKVDRYFKQKESERDETRSKANILDLFKSSNIRTNTLCIYVNWFMCGLCFYGVAYFMGSFGGNIFINVALSAATQLPSSSVVWFLRVLGRKKTLFMCNSLAGVLLLLFTVTPWNWLKVCLTSGAMFALCMSFGTVYIYSGELFPTVLRNVGMGSASMLARVGSMSAPHIVALVKVSGWLPPLILGIIPVVAALLCLKLPETLNCKLPDSLDELEKFCEDKKRRKSYTNN